MSDEIWVQTMASAEVEVRASWLTEAWEEVRVEEGVGSDQQIRRGWWEEEWKR